MMHHVEEWVTIHENNSLKLLAGVHDRLIWLRWLWSGSSFAIPIEAAPRLARFLKELEKETA